MKIATGTRALVTGASRGIGLALVRELAARGASVGLAARSQDELDAVVAGLPGSGHEALQCDVADAASVAAAVERFGAGGRIDIVVANAGIAHYGAFLDVELERLEQMTQVNWVGTLYTAKAALPPMIAQGSGHFVIVSSGAGLRSFPQAATYGATKAAQRAFGEALWHELDGTGVGLTIVYPGEIASTLHDHEKDRMPAWYRGGPDAEPAEAMAKAMLAGIESGARAVYHPPIVRTLRWANGLSPAVADRLLRRLRGRSAAPRSRA